MRARRARIVCTIGPATGTKEAVFGMVRGGMDVARLNFSHGDHESHHRALRAVREGAAKYGRPVAVLQDLQGIKIRTGPMRDGAVRLLKGASLEIAPGRAAGTAEKICIDYAGLARDAAVGDRLLLDDGLIELVVTGRSGRSLKARVKEGGILMDRKGVNLPGVSISASAFTPKDREDLAFGIKAGVDYVAVSFVRSAADIVKVKKYLAGQGAEIPLIAKIEKPGAVDNIGEILEEADGIMVARGDLGVELPPEDIPLIQKSLIEKANRKGRLVITATQMLESMTVHATPTRAEATDVANAVIDGTDALMLSAETSTGKYPLKALSMMDRIIRKTEQQREAVRSYMPGDSFSEALAESASSAADVTGAKFIVAFTLSGYTARLLSKVRPHAPVLAFTPREHVRRRMSLYLGVTPMIMRRLRSTDAVFSEVERALLEKRLVKPGDRIVITASTPVGVSGRTNLMKLHRIGGDTD
jgi:pyruvate kinase